MREGSLPQGVALLEMLENGFLRHGEIFSAPDRSLVVADPGWARSIFANALGDYAEHSDFFATSRGTLGPRGVQQRIGREARVMLAQFAAAHAAELPELVEARLTSSIRFPDAANLLLYQHLGPVLLTPGTSPRLLAAIADVVEHAVLAGARDRRSRMQRALLRRRTHRLLATEVAGRQAAPDRPAADLLDVVALATKAADSPKRAGETFLSLLFATVGSVGFLLAWSLYLLGTHAEASGATPASVVREALRLWPVAWLFGRAAARPHRIGDARVSPGEQVRICTYLVHRHPAHWQQPRAFRPQRWTDSAHPAFLPFGWGPHACTGAAISLDLVERLLRIITDGYDLSVRVLDPRPQVGPALAPPPFLMRLRPRTSSE